MTSSLLPAEFTTVTLTGQYVNLDGTPVAGYLTFTPSPTILRAARSKDLIVPVAINVALDGTGSFSIALPATDDPDINPDHWTYQVLEGFGNRRTYSVQILLESGATQNIFDLAPVAAANGTYYELGPTGPAGPPALITSGPPAATVGGTGDYALDPAAGILYGPKGQSTGWGTGTHLAAADVAAHAALTQSHGVQAGSALVGTTDTQTLSHKTLTAPVVTGGLSTDTASVSGNLSVTGDVGAHNVTGNIGAFAEVTVANTPVSANDAVRKDYVDSTAGTASNVASALVRRSSDGAFAVSAITGLGTPTQTDSATNKSYVDAQVATKAAIAGDLGGTAAAPTVTSGANHTHTSAQVSDATSSGTANTVMKRDATNGVSIGSVYVGNTPTAANHATRKDYVDGQISGLSGTYQALSGKGAASGYAALDASSGVLVPVYAELTEQTNAPANPAAGASRLYINTNHRLVSLDSTGQTRPYGAYIGSGTAFPTTQLVIGDVFKRTDIGTNGTLYQYNGNAAVGSAGWTVESPVICTSTTRPASGLYASLQIFETDTFRMWMWQGSFWVDISVPGVWNNLTLTGTVASTFGFTPAYRYRDNGATVELRGVVTWAATPGTYPVVFVAANGLPAVARPKQVSYFVSKANGAILANGQINVDGSIQINDATSRTFTYVSLDNLSYDVTA